MSIAALLADTRSARHKLCAMAFNAGLYACVMLTPALPCRCWTPPAQANQVWWVYDRWCERSRGKPQHPRDLQLDVGAMQEAASHLLGCHDFTTFQDTRRPSGNRAWQVTQPLCDKYVFAARVSY
jgi:tRNA U38,U39,U40 pseudouridine synthase TruA